MTVVDWLLDSDPAIRWQAMRDLTERARRGGRRRARAGRDRRLGRPAARQADGRRAVGRERLYALHRQPRRPGLHALMLLRDMGLDPASGRRGAPSARVRDAHRPLRGRPALLRRRGRGLHQRAAAGARRLFRRALRPVLDATARRAAQRRRLELRGAAEPARLVPQHDLRARGAPGVRARQGRDARGDRARARGEAYLLERRLFRRRSTGAVVDPGWTRFSTRPATTTTCCAASTTCAAPAPRPTPGSPRRSSSWKKTGTADGRWPRAPPRRQIDFGLAEPADEPSRWNTLRALRVLAWAGRGG